MFFKIRFTGSLLALLILLAGCVTGQMSRAVEMPAQPQFEGTPFEKIVTVIPEAGRTTLEAERTTLEDERTTLEDERTTLEAGQATLEDERATLEAGPALADPAGDEEARETAIANLRALLGDPELELVIKGLERSPNAINSPTALFVDSMENRYYVSLETLQPVEFTIEHAYDRAAGEPKSAVELREIATQLAASHSSKFETLRGSLTYTEGVKGGENSFFRWELAGTDMGGMPPILQIGLKQDGSLFSYLNSLDLLP